MGRWAMSLVTASFAASLIVAGCGHSEPSVTPSPRRSANPSPTALTVGEAGEVYLGAVGPRNIAAKTFNQQVQSWTPSTSNALAVAEAAVLVTADRKFATILEDARWPAVAAGGIQSLGLNITQAIQSLETLSTLNFADVSTWVHNFDAILNAGTADADAIRHDLDLPPA